MRYFSTAAVATLLLAVSVHAGPKNDVTNETKYECTGNCAGTSNSGPSNTNSNSQTQTISPQLSAAPPMASAATGALGALGSMASKAKMAVSRKSPSSNKSSSPSGGPSGGRPQQASPVRPQGNRTSQKNATPQRTSIPQRNPGPQRTAGVQNNRSANATPRGNAAPGGRRGRGRKVKRSAIELFRRQAQDPTPEQIAQMINERSPLPDALQAPVFQAAQSLGLNHPDPATLAPTPLSTQFKSAPCAEYIQALQQGAQSIPPVILQAVQANWTGAPHRRSVDLDDEPELFIRDAEIDDERSEVLSLLARALDDEDVATLEARDLSDFETSELMKREAGVGSSLAAQDDNDMSEFDRIHVFKIMGLIASNPTAQKRVLQALNNDPELNELIKRLETNYGGN